MSRRKEPAIPSDLLDQLLAGGDAAAALQQGGLLDSLKKALAERALNAEMDHHLGQDEQAGNSRNGYGRKTVATDTGDAAIPFEALTDAKLVLTDELIAATLKAQKDKGFDETKFDEIEVDDADDAEDGDDAPPPAERETPTP
jgi:hypothetical protein